MTEVCKWITDEMDDYEPWETDCNHTFHFEEGTPDENGFKFCPYCGKRILSEVSPMRA